MFSKLVLLFFALSSYCSLLVLAKGSTTPDLPIPKQTPAEDTTDIQDPTNSSIPSLQSHGRLLQASAAISLKTSTHNITGLANTTLFSTLLTLELARAILLSAQKDLQANHTAAAILTAPGYSHQYADWEFIIGIADGVELHYLVAETVVKRYLRLLPSADGGSNGNSSLIQTRVGRLNRGEKIVGEVAFLPLRFQDGDRAATMEGGTEWTTDDDIEGLVEGEDGVALVNGTAVGPERVIVETLGVNGVKSVRVEAVGEVEALLDFLEQDFTETEGDVGGHASGVGTQGNDKRELSLHGVGRQDIGLLHRKRQFSDIERALFWRVGEHGMKAFVQWYTQMNGLEQRVVHIVGASLVVAAIQAWVLDMNLRGNESQYEREVREVAQTTFDYHVGGVLVRYTVRLDGEIVLVEDRGSIVRGMIETLADKVRRHWLKKPMPSMYGDIHKYASGTATEGPGVKIGSYNLTAEKVPAARIDDELRRRV